MQQYSPDQFNPNVTENIDESKIKDLIKIVFLGESGVGKTNIMHVFQKGEFNPDSKSTIGVDFAL